jgi:hypothetical protein
MNLQSSEEESEDAQGLDFVESFVRRSQQKSGLAARIQDLLSPCSKKDA